MLEPPETGTNTGTEPAASSVIAVTARGFGDDYPAEVDNAFVRAASVVLLMSLLVYVPWLIGHSNWSYPGVTWPFLLAHVLSLGALLLKVCTTWTRSVPPPRPVRDGAEPLVGIIIPTAGEPAAMVLRTVVSVLEQEWPTRRRIVLVSDDAHDPALRAALAPYPVLYHEPPDRYAPDRAGEGKAGNLNSALDRLYELAPDVEYIETRDADDELGSNSFLRLAVGQLVHDPSVAYVQTIKEAQVSAGDPFNNREPRFYRNLMLAKHHANAVFPCGSGLVWRRSALDEIGGFPTWNLVEDLQSGLEALRRGWRGVYLPIVGAVGQDVPEDVPKVIERRQRWAVDTVRLMVWADRRGLTVKQNAHFASMLLDYVTAFCTFVYVGVVIAALAGHSPVDDPNASAFLMILPFVLANEAFLLATNQPFNDRRRRQRNPINDVWRARVVRTGLSPAYASATVKAIVGGPRRKPVHRAAPREHARRWHWPQVVPHVLLLTTLLAAVFYSVANHTLMEPGTVAISLYFGCLYGGLTASFIALSWHRPAPRSRDDR